VPGSPGATTTTVAAVTGGGGGGSTAPSGGSTDAATDIGDVDAPVDLEEGVIEEEGELLGVDEGDFETALGETETVGAIELSDGYESTFLLGIAGFVAVLAILGFGARRLVLRRGIGEMKG